MYVARATAFTRAMRLAARAAQVYARQKTQMLADHTFLSVLGAAAFWSLLSPSATASYAVGAFLGALYLFLLQRQTDSLGASSLEDVRAALSA
eukprot:615404-Prymnesium_polylepis.1